MIDKVLDKKILLYFTASVIPLLSISIFFADLIISLLSIIFLIFLFKENISIFYKNSFFLIFLIFYFLCIFSSFFSEDVAFSLKSSLPLIRVVVFIFLLSYLIKKNNDTVDIFYNFIKFTFLFLTLYGILSYLINYRILFLEDALDLKNIRLTLPFSDEQKLGSYLVRLYGLFFGLHLLKKKKYKFENIFFFILSLMTATVVLLSGERTSLFFLMLFVFISLILLKISFKLKIIYFLPIIFFGFIFLFFNSNLSKRIIFDKNNQISFSQNNIIIFTAQHTAHYKSGLKIFFDKPLIGQGPKMFRKLCKKTDYSVTVVKSSGQRYQGCSSHPHNTYIQLLAESGIVATLIFSLVFFHIIINFIKHFFFLTIRKGKELKNYQVIINLSALITFWPFSPSGNFFNNWMLIIYSLSICLYVNEYFGFKKNNKDKTYFPK